MANDPIGLARVFISPCRSVTSCIRTSVRNRGCGGSAMLVHLVLMPAALPSINSRNVIPNMLKKYPRTGSGGPACRGWIGSGKTMPISPPPSVGSIATSTCTITEDGNGVFPIRKLCNPRTNAGGKLSWAWSETPDQSNTAPRQNTLAAKYSNLSVWIAGTCTPENT